jgi:hypothetical protein
MIPLLTRLCIIVYMNANFGIEKNACNIFHELRAVADFVILLSYFYDRIVLIICFYCALPKFDSYYNSPVCFRNVTIALLVSVLLSNVDMELCCSALFSI